jgi:hypothetical protein
MQETPSAASSLSRSNEEATPDNEYLEIENIHDPLEVHNFPESMSEIGDTDDVPEINKSPPRKNKVVAPPRKSLSPRQSQEVTNRLHTLSTK